MSVLARVHQDVTHAFTDAYSSLVLGDDAGKAARMVFVLRPNTNNKSPNSRRGSSSRRSSRSSHHHGGDALNLGMTFLEVGGRAYVKTVDPTSEAAHAGILPRDAVQFAAVVKNEWQQQVGQTTTNNGGGGNGLQQNNNGTNVEGGGGDIASDILQTDSQEISDEAASKFALECESRGMRVTYSELRRILREGTNVHHVFTSPCSPGGGGGGGAGGRNGNQQQKQSNNSKWSGPPIPSTINVCAPNENVDEFVKNNGGMNHPLSPFRGEKPRPVVFVLRRTRQRQAGGNQGIGILPSFRMDDECDIASSLIRRMAPTNDMIIPPPDTWEELVQDGTDWLLGSGSMLPLHNSNNTGNNSNSNNITNGMLSTTKDNNNNNNSNNSDSAANSPEEESGIPLDDYEKERSIKIAKLRDQMALEAMQVDRTVDVEAATIRGMIQKAVGLAFIRASKVVLGVSVHGGSGIVIARLSDGTWSAPSAIGTWGMGLGVQFGLEVAEYIFILQTEESLEHFRRGGSFTIGGNVGAAVAGMGREAYGAASLTTTCGGPIEPLNRTKDDEYNDDDSAGGRNKNGGAGGNASSVGIAPIVAYAKSQGLYVGVSLEGSRIFTRDDINAKAYKFTTGREVTAYDILSGKVATPPEAEDLYASLHSVEFTHEMSCLPRPPEILRKDSPNSWCYDKSTLEEATTKASSKSSDNRSYAFTFLQDMTKEEAAECDAFETDFKRFMYGGVSVQRLIPNSERSGGKTRKERRTLWLMLPEMGALRLGFVSKLSDGEGADVSNKISTSRAKASDFSVSALEGDQNTVASEEVTLDSAILEKETNIGQIRTGNVQLSSTHSVALTDVTLLSQEPHIPIRFNNDDKTEHLRVIQIQDVTGASLLFVANNFREAELLVCGLKLLLERETARLSVRGGLPISALGGRVGEGAMSPDAARGFRETRIVTTKGNGSNGRNSRQDLRGKHHRRNNSGGSVSGTEDDGNVMTMSTEDHFGLQARHTVPAGRKNWGKMPGRDYMRGQASQSEQHAENNSNLYGQIPKYVHGQLLVRDIATKVVLPLPLPLCRVLLLDSSSPVITKWEKDRGDSNFEKTEWTFPSATPRELEHHTSEHQLIASGSMMGAHRTTSFDRLRNGSVVRLIETQIIDADDSEKLVFTVSERLPRRGFSIKVRVLLRSSKENSTEATVLADVRPVGKNMTNQAAVHKAFMLVLNEITMRYGTEKKGLMAGFLSVVNSLPINGTPGSSIGGVNGSAVTGAGENHRPIFPKTEPREDNLRTGEMHTNHNKSRSDPPSGKESGLVSFEDILKPNQSINGPSDRPATPSLLNAEDYPSTKKKRMDKFSSSDFADMPMDEQEQEKNGISNKPATIEVKPLPKIRLSLMPSPREEDEENLSNGERNHVVKKKKSGRRKSLSGRK